MVETTNLNSSRMKKINIIILILFLTITVGTLRALKQPEQKMQQREITADTVEQDREKHLAAAMEWIKGKEELPADSVFKDIKIFNDMPAGRMLRIMDVAFSRSLGVSCGHCHNTSDWASDEKPEKQIAREMWKMAGTINGDLLKAIDGLENPRINCTTCHRGEVVPALRLEE